jgi:hypothetical protein
MKGTLVNQLLEWNIEVFGETWEQGQKLKTQIKVKNLDRSPINLSFAGIGIAKADMKKVQARTIGAFEFHEKYQLPIKIIEPQEEKFFEYTFVLSPNAQITDKKTSLYLCFGNNFEEGHLQLKIIPQAIFTKITSLIETFHRFKIKEVKGNKTSVEYRFIPPSARETSHIESMIINMSVEEERLKTIFNFKIKKLDPNSIKTSFKSENISKEILLNPNQYLLGKDLINQDLILQFLDTVLSQVKMKNVY